MSTTQVIDPADVICGLKAAVTALECYHNINLLKQQQQFQKVELSPPPMYMMIPIEEEKVAKKLKKKSDTKRIASAARSVKKSRKVAECTSARDKKMSKKEEYCSSGSDIPDLKFPEMRSGILFTRCYCVHRDGMQDSCPLSQCQGNPDCLVKPWPVCAPAKFLRSRHPEVYSMPPNPDSITH